MVDKRAAIPRCFIFNVDLVWPCGMMLLDNNLASLRISSPLQLNVAAMTTAGKGHEAALLGGGNALLPSLRYL